MASVCSISCALYHGGLQPTWLQTLRSLLLHLGIFLAHTVYELSSSGSFLSPTVSFISFGRRRLSKLTYISVNVLDIATKRCGATVMAMQVRQQVSSDKCGVAARDESVSVHVFGFSFLSVVRMFCVPAVHCRFVLRLLFCRYCYYLQYRDSFYIEVYCIVDRFATSCGTSGSMRRMLSFIVRPLYQLVAAIGCLLLFATILYLLGCCSLRFGNWPVLRAVFSYCDAPILLLGLLFVFRICCCLLFDVRRFSSSLFCSAWLALYIFFRAHQVNA